MPQGPINGVVIARVVANQDPANEGRISVTFPWLQEEHEPRWLPVASPMAGTERGLFMMPEPDDEVLVAFDHGDFDHGYVVGFLWNPVHRPPADNPNARVMVSREGHRLGLYDMDERDGNKGAIVLQDAHFNAITMTNGVMSIYSRGTLVIDASTVIIKGRVVNPLGGRAI